MLYVDRRLGGVERWLYTKPHDRMRIGEQVLSSVFFVCAKDSKGNYRAKGTAFLMAFPKVGYRESYLVSARHVIEAARDDGGYLYLRANTKDGQVVYVPISADEWWKPNDEGVDIAVLPFEHDPIIDAAVLDADLIATDDLIKEHGIGIGDEIAIVGLFTSREGRERNRPVVRTGVIAAMPDEAIVEPPDENAPDEPSAPFYAYLAEVRSHGGLSGSPVSVFLGPSRDESGRRITTGVDFVLGVVRAHWANPSRAPYGSFSIDAEAGTVNTGIALVTPIQEVAKLLMSDRAKKHRANVSSARRKGQARIVPDSAENG